MQATEFVIDSNAICFGAPHNIVYGAQQPIAAVPRSPQLAEGGTVFKQIVPHNLAARNGVWKAYPLVYETSCAENDNATCVADSGTIAAWYAGHVSLDPYAEAKRILEVANSPYEEDYGVTRNTDATWEGRVFVLNRYDWAYEDIRGYEEAHDERDGDYFLKDIYLVDYGHVLGTIQDGTWSGSNTWMGIRDSVNSGAAMPLQHAEYIFARFGMTEDRTKVHSFLLFSASTELSRTFFSQAPHQKAPIYIKLTPEQRHAKRLADGTYSGFDFLRGSPGPRISRRRRNGKLPTLRGPLPVQLLDLEALRTLQQQHCPLTPFEPELIKDIVQLLNECIGCWVTWLVTAAHNRKTKNGWLDAVLPARNMEGSLDWLLYTRGTVLDFLLNTKAIVEASQTTPTEATPSTLVLLSSSALQTIAPESHALWSVTTRKELAGMIQLILSEVFELAGNCARDNYRSVLVPVDIRLAIVNDKELFKKLGMHTRMFYPPDMWEDGEG